MSPLTLTKSQFCVFFFTKFTNTYTLLVTKKKKSDLPPFLYPQASRSEENPSSFVLLCAIHVQGMASFTLHACAGACNFFVLPILLRFPILAI
jgi:hypothetical protein